MRSNSFFALVVPRLLDPARHAMPGLPGTPVEVLPVPEGGQHPLLRDTLRDPPRAPKTGRGQRRLGLQAHRAQHR